MKIGINPFFKVFIGINNRYKNYSNKFSCSFKGECFTTCFGFIIMFIIIPYGYLRKDNNLFLLIIILHTLVIKCF